MNRRLSPSLDVVCLSDLKNLEGGRNGSSSPELGVTSSIPVSDMETALFEAGMCSIKGLWRSHATGSIIMQHAAKNIATASLFAVFEYSLGLVEKEKVVCLLQIL